MKSRDEQIASIKIAQNIKGPYFANLEDVRTHQYLYYWKQIDDDMEFDEIAAIESNNKLLLQIVERCLDEKFPLEDYHIFEIPYGNEHGLLFSFIHTKEYERYKNGEISIAAVRQIDFFSKYDGGVVPEKLLYSEEKGYTTQAMVAIKFYLNANKINI